MITYEALQADRRQFLALTGLTLREFHRLLTAFPGAYTVAVREPIDGMNGRK